MESTDLQIPEFYLVVKLHWGGSATKGAGVQSFIHTSIMCLTLQFTKMLVILGPHFATSLFQTCAVQVLKDFSGFQLEERGEMDIKGKGK